MELFPYALLGAIGLVVGSFLGAYTYRWQKGISVLHGRSFCPTCRAKIAWFDNIPLLSFLLLSGSCRACGKKISSRYPAIEFVTAALFLMVGKFLTDCSGGTSLSLLCNWQMHLGLWIYPFVLAVISISLAIFVIDLESKVIPDELVFVGILLVTVFYLFAQPDLIFKNFLVGFAAAAAFLGIHLLTRGRGMGLGDVKFVIFGALLLGWPQSLVWLFLSFISGAVLGLILILLKKAKFGREIPFGPYLTTSLIATMFFGEKLLTFYLLL